MTSSVATETQLLVASCFSSGLFQFETILDGNATTFFQIDQEYVEKINKVQAYLEKVEKIVGPGCSKEVLNVAFNSMSLLVQALSDISSTPKPHSSL